MSQLFGGRCEGQCQVTEKCDAVKVGVKCVGKNVCASFLEHVHGGLWSWGLMNNQSWSANQSIPDG